ncbi:MAG: hydrogenase maturation nickel metallochaperone HypA [Planctomycetes bacterium]|nr:hydrogenase maturation nickel metallochaperone HypA [Planctomycetota bacterium]
MHELSIARNVVEIATEALRDAGGGTVSVVRVRVGVLAGVAPEALTFCYEIAIRGTPLEGSQLLVEVAPVVLHCPTCDRDAQPPDICHLECPVCGTATADVRGGRELEVESIEVI